MDFEIRVDGFTGWEEFQPILHALDPGKRYIDKAIGRTNLRMSEWVMTRIVSQLARKLKIRQATLRGRLRKAGIHGDITNMKIWAGLDGVPFTNLKPMKYKSGVRTGDGGYYVEGAFITQARKTGRLRVYKRKYQQNFPEHHGYPIVDVMLEISNEATTIMEKIIRSNEFEERYMKRLAHDLGYLADKNG